MLRSVFESEIYSKNLVPVSPELSTKILQLIRLALFISAGLALTFKSDEEVGSHGDDHLYNFYMRCH